VKVATGGTFNPFHDGHRRLLAKAAEVATEIHIGIADGPLIAKKGRPIAPWPERAKECTDYIHSIGFKGTVIVAPIIHPAGGILSGEHYDAIVVSKDTVERGHALANQYNAINGEILLVIEAPTVLGVDGAPLSSTKVYAKMQTTPKRLT